MKRMLVVLMCLVAATAAWAQVKVVYHLNEGIPQASRALPNIRNHLTADPTVKVVVVTHGPGIDFLLDGAVNLKDQPFSGVAEVARLQAKDGFVYLRP